MAIINIENKDLQEHENNVLNTLANVITWPTNNNLRIKLEKIKIMQNQL